MMSLRKKILVIDDDEAVFGYLSRKMGKEFVFVTTSQAESALDMALRFDPDLVLCDIDMPEVTGGDVSTVFMNCEHTRRIPFAYMTALVTRDEVRAGCQWAGSRRLIAKCTPVPEMAHLFNQLMCGSTEKACV